MAAVLIALYDTHETAERVRTRLVRDGFPTDRVRLLSGREPGVVQSMPAGDQGAKYHQYVRTLLGDDAAHADRLAERIERGAAAVSVLPRGEAEIARAREIMAREGPVELTGRDLDDTLLERAAAPHDRSVLGTVLGTRRPD